MRFFLDPPPWFAFLAGRDFAFGSRIHGTIAALIAGTPAVVLAHDSRTLELARYFDIPHRLLRDVDPATLDAADLLAEADFGPLVTGHAERYARFVGFLDRHGLDHVFRSPAPRPDPALRLGGGDWSAAVTVRSRVRPHGLSRPAEAQPPTDQAPRPVAPGPTDPDDAGPARRGPLTGRPGPGDRSRAGNRMAPVGVERSGPTAHWWRPLRDL